MSKAKTVKEALIATKWILENVGWTQGTYFRDKQGEMTSGFPTSGPPTTNLGSACLVGSLRLVDMVDEPGENNLYSQTVNQMTHSLRSMHGTVMLTTWNDASDRTKEQVLAFLDQAIADAEKKQ